MPSKTFEDYQFQATPDEAFVCSTWFERDRAHVRLETPNGKLVFELWDAGVWQAIEDGYLPVPRVPRPRDSDWQPCAVAYARAHGLFASAAARRAARAVSEAGHSVEASTVRPRLRA